jgi:hypothetical protein
VADFSSHIPGTFSWAELATTDQKAGVSFYRDLFSWGVNEQPMGPDAVYSMFQMRGQEVAAACSLRPEDLQHGVPPHWNMYVSVANVDEAVKRAQELGGKLVAPPFDVFDAGRMAVLQDPTGAMFCVWQAKQHIGAKILGEPGALCWTELATRDTKAAESFYTKLFGWTAKHSSPDSPMQYTEFSNQGQPGVGMMPMPAQVPEFVPAHWMPYFAVANCDASTSHAKELGANVRVPPQDIPKTGRFSVLADPQGAMFALFTFAAAQ